MTTYKIIRRYQAANRNNRTLQRGLTLEEARAHCQDPESDSSSCTTAHGRRRTKLLGAWSDGYTKEK